MYENILKLLEIYENSDMKDIKKNLYDIFKYKKLNKGSFAIIGISKHQEQSYLNQAHPHNIPFITLIKICNYLNISIEDVTKENRYTPDKSKSKNTIKWTESKKKEFLKSVEEFGVEETSKKYKISINTTVKYMDLFKGGVKFE